MKQSCDTWRRKGMRFTSLSLDTRCRNLLQQRIKRRVAEGGHDIRNMQYDVGSTDRWEDFAPVIT